MTLIVFQHDTKQDEVVNGSANDGDGKRKSFIFLAIWTRRYLSLFMSLPVWRVKHDTTYRSASDELRMDITHWR